MILRLITISTISQAGGFGDILKPFTIAVNRNAVPQVLNGECANLLSVARDEPEDKILMLRKDRLKMEYALRLLPKSGERILTPDKDCLETTFEFREPQLKYESMVEQSGDMILVAMDGYIAYANSRVMALSGYSKEELLKIHIVRMIHPDDHPRVMDLYRQQANLEEMETLIRFRMLRKDQTWFWVEMSHGEILWGGKAAILAAWRDISERVRAEEDLRIKELAIASSPNAVFFADLGGAITHVNRSFLKILGYKSEEELRGRPIQELILVPGPDKDRPVLETLLSAEGGLCEMKGRRKDGSIRDLQVSIAMVKDDADKPLCIMGSFPDITDQKRMAELMLRSEKLTSLGHLAAGLAHELKNPLAVISSCAQFCLDNTAMDRPLKENLQVIYRNSRRANRLIEELLNFARPSRRLLRKEVDINDLLLRTIEMANLEMQAHKTSFVTDLQPDLPKTFGDEDKLRQVFLNIIMNALQAISGKGAVTVHTAFNDIRGCIRVDIADDGPGIPMDYRHRIFDPFFSTKDRGTGLGLSICHSIVEEHEGEILVECPERGGTRLSIRLPLRASLPDGA